MTIAGIKMAEDTKKWVQTTNKTKDNLLIFNKVHIKSTTQCQLTPSITHNKTSSTKIDMFLEKKMILVLIMIFQSNTPIKGKECLTRISFISSSLIISNRVWGINSLSNKIFILLDNKISILKLNLWENYWMTK